MPKAINPLHDYLSSTAGSEYLSFSRMYSPLPLGRIQYTRVMNSNKTKSPKNGVSKNNKATRPAQPRTMVQSDRPGPNRQQRRAASRAANKSVGRSAYAPSALATGTNSMAPLIQGGRNSTRIVHRELVASIVGSAAFAVNQSIPLNPGLASSFPWLSSQAQAWEQYRFNRLKFCYYTRTGSSTSGSVQLVPDYDAADAAPASEQIASSFEDVVEDAPWKDLESVLNPQAMFPMGPKKFIRSGALPANLDIKTYDAGQMFVCTTDGAAVNWGKLWVEYDVELSVPANPAAGSLAAASQHVTSTSPVSADLFPTPIVLAGSSALATLSGKTLTFLQAGKYLVALNLSATTTFINSVAASGGASLVLSYAGGAGYFLSGNGTGQWSINALVNATAGSTLTVDTTITAGAFAEVAIAAVPSIQT